MQVVHIPRTELHDYIQSLRSEPFDVYWVQIDPEDSACYMVALVERRDIETR
jgi:hypothetical protein